MRTLFLLVLVIGMGGAWAVMVMAGGLTSLTNLGIVAGGTLLGAAVAYVVGVREGSIRRASRLAALTAAAGLAVLLLEVPAMLDVFDYRTVLVPKMPGGKGPHNRVLEPGILYRRPPHDEFTSELYGDAVVVAGMAADRRYRVDYRADANGMRNAADLERADVVLVGDSFVEGYRVGQDQTVAACLAHATGKAVVNLGHSGWGPGHELAALERFGLPLRPHIVMWFFFEGNDLRNLAEHRAAMADFDAWQRAENRYGQRSLVSNVGRVLLGLASAHARNGDSERARRLSGTFTDAGGREHRLCFTIRPFALDARRRALLDGTYEILERARDATSSAGGDLLIVFVPAKFRVYGGRCRYDEASWCRDWDMNTLPRRMAAWARAGGVHYVDLTEALGERAARGELLYLPDDPHWNPAGNRTVAECLIPLVLR